MGPEPRAASAVGRQIIDDQRIVSVASPLTTAAGTYTGPPSQDSFRVRRVSSRVTVPVASSSIAMSVWSSNRVSNAIRRPSGVQETCPT